MNNSFGTLFKLTTFGESHGIAIGGVIDGCPAGIYLDFKSIQYQLDRRKPGQSKITTQRKESDTVIFISGIFEGKTTGTPIAFQIINENQKSKDYSHNKDVFRPSHADFTYQKKYGIRDYRGGGRSSARETANWVVAGAIAKQVISKHFKSEILVNAYTSSIGKIYLEKPYQEVDFSKVDDSIVRCPEKETSKKMIALIEEIKKDGDTIGGKITCAITNMPIGLGEPIFNKLHAQLGNAMLTINAVKGFEFGTGFCAAEMRGSEHNDSFNEDGTTKSNLSGGIQGGISNGMDIYFRVGFKPVATIMQEQDTIDIHGNKVKLQGKGRHDPCVVPRAIPIVEALTNLVLLNFLMLNKSKQQ